MKELLKQINLLYVEDDDTVRSLLERVLRNRVKNLYVAKDGQEGYEKFVEHQPDIVLTDIKMPKLNGLEMSRKIKSIKKDVPIIIMSAHSETGFFLDAIELGVDAYLLKPIDKTKLMKSLGDYAKVILFEKEKEKNQRLLHAVIDIQPSVIFSCKEEPSILFANKQFVKLFCKKDDISDKLFCIHKDLIDNKNVTLLEEESHFWIDYIFSHPNKNFKIDLPRNDKRIEFLVKTKQIKNTKDDNAIIVVTLFEL